MPAPATRYKLLPARGAYAALAAALVDIAEGEIVYATDQDLYYQKEGGVLTPVGVPEAPNDGTQYVRQNQSWAAVDVPPGTIVGTSEDLPGTIETGQLWYDTDTSRLFVYTGTEWVLTSPVASTVTADTPPSNPQDGDLWFDTSDGSGRLYVYYVDADSNQWVDASPDSTGEWLRDDLTSTISTAIAGDSVDIGSSNILLNADGSANFAGNVGIGTTNSTAALEVQSASNTTIRIDNEDDSTATLVFHNTGSTDRQISVVNGEMTFGGSSDEQMRIDSSGRLGLGTSSPETNLEVEVANSNGDTALQITNQVSGGGTNSATTASLNLAPSSFGSASIAQVQAVREGTWSSTTTRRTALTLKTTQDTSVGPVDRLYITSEGRVGIGQINPTQLLHLTSTGSNAFLQFSDSGSGGSDAQVRIGSNGNDLVVLNNTSSNTAIERMRVRSAGGLTFNGDTAAANALDDYEEGTWTPTVIGTSSAGTVTYTQRIGEYTKIGNMVTVLLEAGWNSGTGSGNLAITGLPFTTTRNVVEAMGASSQLTYASGQTPYVYTSSSANVYVGVSAPSSGAAPLAYDSAATIFVTFSYFV